MMYGAIYKIEEQLNHMGYTLEDKEELIEKLHFGLNICHIHGIITEKEWNRGLQRLNKMISKYAKPYNEPGINPCRGCADYAGNGGCKSNGGCADTRNV